MDFVWYTFAVLLKPENTRDALSPLVNKPSFVKIKIREIEKPVTDAQIVSSWFRLCTSGIADSVITVSS